MQGYVNTLENEADLLTKTLPTGEKRRSFVRDVSCITYIGVIEVE